MGYVTLESVVFVLFFLWMGAPGWLAGLVGFFDLIFRLFGRSAFLF